MNSSSEHSLQGEGSGWNNESGAGHMDTGVIKFTCQSLYFIGTTLYNHLDGANCAIYILKGQNVGVAIAETRLLLTHLLAYTLVVSRQPAHL